MTYPEPIKIPSMAEVLAMLLHSGATDEQAKQNAQRYRADLIDAAEHQAKVAKTMDAFARENGERWLPTDQGRNPDMAERKKSRFMQAEWSLVKRWPWIAIWEDGWDCSIPPWAQGGFRYVGHRQAIAASLRYCLEHSSDLPQLTPVGDRIYFSAASNPQGLPPLKNISGKHIPRGIVKQYRTARCGEALAFVCHFTGGPEIDEIRRLIMAPSIERVAEAYAIATSYGFRRARLVESYEAEIERHESPSISQHTTNMKLPELAVLCPLLRRKSGVPRRVMADLLNADEPLSVNRLAGAQRGKKASGGARQRVNAALQSLEKEKLAVRVGSDDWQPGPAARRKK